MYEVKVKKDKLLGIIEKNRKKHRAIFEKAIAGYRKEVIRHLDYALKAARSGKKIITAVKLIQPQDHTADYDREIGMLKMSADNLITIDDTQYQQYILNQWEWTKQFSTTSASYSGSTSSSSLSRLYLQNHGREGIVRDSGGTEDDCGLGEGLEGGDNYEYRIDY